MAKLGGTFGTKGLAGGANTAPTLDVYPVPLASFSLIDFEIYEFMFWPDEVSFKESEIGYFEI